MWLDRIRFRHTKKKSKSIWWEKLVKSAFKINETELICEDGGKRRNLFVLFFFPFVFLNVNVFRFCKVACYHNSPLSFRKTDKRMLGLRNIDIFSILVQHLDHNVLIWSFVISYPYAYRRGDRISYTETSSRQSRLNHIYPSMTSPWDNPNIVVLFRLFSLPYKNILFYGIPMWIGDRQKTSLSQMSPKLLSKRIPKWPFWRQKSFGFIFLLLL